MRKQVGQIDAELLARVDALASQRGQTRRVVVERALEAVLSEAKGDPLTTQSGPAPVPSSESDGVRPAAQPRTHGKLTAGEPITAGEEVRIDVTGAVVPAVPADAAQFDRATRPKRPGIVSQAFEDLDGAA